MGAVSEITGECDKDHTHQIVIPALPGRYYRWVGKAGQTIEGLVYGDGKSDPPPCFQLVFWSARPHTFPLARAGLRLATVRDLEPAFAS
jgi:hypothetical protein